MESKRSIIPLFVPSKWFLVAPFFSSDFVWNTLISRLGFFFIWHEKKFFRGFQSNAFDPLLSSSFSSFLYQNECRLFFFTFFPIEDSRAAKKRFSLWSNEECFWPPRFRFITFPLYQPSLFTKLGKKWTEMLKVLHLIFFHRTWPWHQHHPVVAFKLNILQPTLPILGSCSTLSHSSHSPLSYNSELVTSFWSVLLF